MPYKNPEDKRRWEREHRQQRNARRRKRSLEVRSSVASEMPDPVPAKKATSGWEILASLTVGIGVAMLAVIAGAVQINSDMPRSAQN